MNYYDSVIYINTFEFYIFYHSFRIEQEGSLIVDNGAIATGASPGLLNQLNVNNGLYLGIVL